MLNKVCALIVTYNRKEYLIKLLNALNHSDGLSAIFIFDNYSNDGTPQLLKDMKIINEVKENTIIEKKIKKIKYLYFRNNENIGGSGGFNKGLELLYKMNIYNFAWIMDDDVLPESDCLMNLMKYQDKDTMITTPNRTDKHFKDKVTIKMNLSNPFKLFTKKKTKFIVEDFRCEDDTIEVVDMTFEGPLINCDLINKIGLPDKEYFILADDTDYAMRATKVTKIKFVRDAILHKQIVATTRKKYMNWKDYYAYRNDILFCRKFGKNIWVKYLTPILCYINLMAKSMIKMKWKNVKVVSRAFIDGYTGKKGKIVNPGEF